jgi:DNA-binding NtrC family response regulator
MAWLMLVDDDPVSLDGLVQALTRYLPGVFIEAFTCPSAALAKLREHDFDVVLSDFNMPGMDGICLLKVARESGSDASFILMTGEATDQIVTDGLRLGMFGLLSKPFHRTAIVPLVKQAIECHHLRREVSDLRRTLAEYGIELSGLMRRVAAERIEESQPLLPY